MNSSSADRAASDARPWLRLMPSSYWEGPTTFDHGLVVFEAALQRAPDSPAIRYFDGTLSYRQVDAESSALAAALVAGGFAPGDRLASFLQNIPAFPIALIATWKAGGTFVPINPMSRARELAIVLADAAPRCLILEPGLYRDSYLSLPAGSARPDMVIVASPFDYQERDDRRVLPERDEVADVPSWAEVIARYRDAAPPRLPPSPASAAFLVYTSGTTGKPKAAIVSHAASGRASSYARRAYGLEDGDAILAVAPVFHTTGLMSTIMTCLNLAGPLVLMYRFDPVVCVDALREHRPRFTAGAPTAFIALIQVAAGDRDVFASFRALGIGGAAVSPTVVERLRHECGVVAQTGFGMTETGGAVTITPHEYRDATPVDSATGALSVGIPLPGVDVWIAGDDGRPVAPGEIGEIVVVAPTMMDGYWQRPDDTAEALRPDGLRTGDVGFMDPNGWFYLVDRKKDVIVAGGYKVWPREVEDVLYTHPAVAEAAVIGIPDSYRGESVKAFVRLRPGAVVAIAELDRHCRDLLSAYKRPRVIDLVDDLPKTISGKIIRAALRT